MDRARARTHGGHTSCAAAWMVAKADVQPSPNSSMPNEAGTQRSDIPTPPMPTQDTPEHPTTVPPRDSLPRTNGSNMPEVTPPIPIIPRMTPYIPGPSPRSRRTNNGSKAHGAAAGIEYEAGRVIA